MQGPRPPLTAALQVLCRVKHEFAEVPQPPRALQRRVARAVVQQQLQRVAAAAGGGGGGADELVQVDGRFEQRARERARAERACAS